MSLTPFDVYMIMNMDNLQAIVVVPMVITITVFVVLLICAAIIAEDYNPDYKSDVRKAFVVKKYLKISGLISFLLLMATGLMPSTQTLVAMYIVPQIQDSQEVQKLPAELQQYINNVLAEQNNKKEK